MAEPLKNQFGVAIPKTIASMVSSTWPKFDSRAFIQMALDGYLDLELTPRAWKIAHALRAHLPDTYTEAIHILLASLGPKLDRTDNLGMESFLYLPHVFFVAEYGLDDFEPSMRAQYELTQRFTAEFSIRAYLERHPDATLARLRAWTRDPSPHVRRLVSEGTRPRLPWAPRLREFQRDPRPVIELLELLKDDPALYVRRSVANNLNDIGKDNPEILIDTTRRWMAGANEERRWLIQHALRGAVKRADPAALEVLGFGGAARVGVAQAAFQPKRPAIGGSVRVAFDVSSTAPRRQRILVDLRVHFVKANGVANPKVFKLKAVDLAPRETIRLEKTIALSEMTTRRHYPGRHVVEAIVSGKTHPLGAFDLRPA